MAGTLAYSFLLHRYRMRSGSYCLVLYLAGKTKKQKTIRMKKIKKSTGVAIAFLIYVSVTAAYLLPRNTEVGQTEKILTVVGSYAIVLLLWLVLRKKEQMRERRKEEQKNELRKKDEQSIHLKK